LPAYRANLNLLNGLLGRREIGILKISSAALELEPSLRPKMRILGSASTDLDGSR
jgi:hypothetical protein